jgi:hypothetical protein
MSRGAGLRVLAAFLMAGGIARAQPDPSELSDAELLGLLGELDAALAAPARVATYGIPSAFGAPHGLAFVSVSGTDRSMRRKDIVDGSMALGFGLGDARRGVSLTPAVVITSVSPQDFGDSGTVGLSLHRAFDAPFGPAAVSAGLENLVRWGDSATLDPGGYVAASGLFDLGRPVMGTLGYGTGVADSGRAPGVFGGIGVGLGSALSVSLAWAGDEAIAGVTLWPERTGRLQVTLGAGDLTHEVDGQRLLFSVSFARDGMF